LQDPSLDCYNAALGVLIYVASSEEYVMKFNGKAGSLQGIDQQVHDRITKNHGLVAYSDASWHYTDELGYDMFGYVIYFAGGPIAFTSKRIKVVAKSSAEAEYAAASSLAWNLHLFAIF
jgi:hypothetical protein